MTTMAFPCNECQAPTTQSHHHDRWLCATCGRDPEPTNTPAFAQDPKPELSREDVVSALAQMAGDKRITNEPVQAIFRRAAQLISGAPEGYTLRPFKYTLEEAQKKHRQVMMESGIDPASERGVEGRANFLAGWKVARAQ